MCARYIQDKYKIASSRRPGPSPKPRGPCAAPGLGRAWAGPGRLPLGILYLSFISWISWIFFCTLLVYFRQHLLLEKLPLGFIRVSLVASGHHDTKAALWRCYYTGKSLLVVAVQLVSHNCDSGLGQLVFNLVFQIRIFECIPRGPFFSISV